MLLLGIYSEPLGTLLWQAGNQNYILEKLKWFVISDWLELFKLVTETFVLLLEWSIKKSFCCCLVISSKVCFDVERMASQFLQMTSQFLQMTSQKNVCPFLLYLFGKNERIFIGQVGRMCNRRRKSEIQKITYKWMR